MSVERQIAGLWCGEVLEDLSAYLDGELAEERRGQLEAHVRECPLCARFGGEFGTTLTRLRAALGAPELPPGSVIARLEVLLDDPASATDGT